MTAGHDGTPENDDPFGYLYRAEDGSEQPEAPRTSYNQVQRVGERRSPQQQPQQGGYGYPQPQQQQPQGGYGYPPAQQQGYGYDQGQGGQTQQGGQAQYTRQQPQYAPGQPGDGGRRGAGPGGPGGHGGGPEARNRKGLLIGAVAVVAAVAIGIAFAMSQSSGKDKQADDKPTTAPTTASAAPSTEPTPSATPSQFASDKVDAATLALAGGAAQASDVPGANAANGTYVTNITQVGASATWNVTVPEDGDYTFFINFGNAGPDATLSLAVDGKMRTTPVKLKNYGHYTDWSKGWDNTTYAYVSLDKGANTLQLSFQQGDTGSVNLDQIWLKQGQVKK